MPKWAKILIGLIAIVILIVVGFLIYVNTAFISKDDVKENLAKHLNVSKNDIYFDSIDLEMEKKFTLILLLLQQIVQKIKTPQK